MGIIGPLIAHPASEAASMFLQKLEIDDPATGTLGALDIEGGGGLKKGP